MILQNKPGQKKKAWRELEPEKGSSVQTAEPAANEENHDGPEHHDDSHDEEVPNQFLEILILFLYAEIHILVVSGDPLDLQFYLI